MRILNQIISLFNIIKLNIKIFFFKKLDPNKKVIFFYHPRKLLTLIHTEYIEDLFYNFDEKTLIVFGHEIIDLKKNNYYYISQGFLFKFLFGIDIFISNNVCDVFTPKSINIYLHHDISTTPLVSLKKELELFNRLLKYNFIYAPYGASLDMFSKFFDKHSNNKIIPLPKIYETGYLRLDYLKKKIKNERYLDNSIVIAPTDNRHLEGLSIFYDIEDIVNKVLNNTKFNIIFRPYPANRSSANEIYEQFKNNKRFTLDLSENYFDIYSKSICMITDTSGTAFTYAFLTKKPVLFFSKSEELLKEYKYEKIPYFLEREKIGIIANNTDEVLKALSNISNIEKNKYETNIKLENEIKYLGNSKERISNLLKEALKS